MGASRVSRQREHSVARTAGALGDCPPQQWSHGVDGAALGKQMALVTLKEPERVSAFDGAEGDPPAAEDPLWTGSANKSPYGS